MRTITFRQLFLNYIKKHPVTAFLLLANLIMFFIVALSGGFTSVNLIKFGGLVPNLVNQGEYWRILTSMFLHASFWHFFFNSFFLYYIGGSVEKILGSTKYAILYIISGIGSGIAVWLFSDPNIPTIGASGALYGIMAALFLMTYIRSSWFHPRTIRSIRFMVAINLFITFASMISDGSISVWGHAGGFLVGLVVVYFMMPKEPYITNRRYRPQPKPETSHYGRTVIDADSVTDDDIYDSHYTN